MKIAVISDTHGNVANFRKVVGWINKENIRVILHCGDIGNPESLKESLEDFTGEFFGVLGNMDIDYKILIDEYNKVPQAKIEEEIFKTEIDNKKIAITHKPERARTLAESGYFDLVFYGHTHKPWEEKIPTKIPSDNKAGKGGCRMINPGELAGQFNKPTFAVYDTATDNLELKILEKL